MVRHEWHGANPFQGVAVVCPYCGATHTPLILGQAHRTFMQRETTQGWTESNTQTRLFACTACHMPYIDLQAEGRTIPGQRLGSSVKNVPPDLARLYEEARDAASASAYTACAMVARKVLMNLAVLEGADKNKSFQFYVDYLAQNGFVPPKGRPWVDKIRTTGNTATHEIEIVSEAEARDVMYLVENLLRFNFEMTGL
jgi:uncharacterized protein DUF4145